MEDTYKEEFLPRLEKSRIFNSLLIKCADRDPEVVALVHEAVSYSNQKSKVTMMHMGEYTLHDCDHFFNVLYLMDRLVPAENLEKLSIPELLLLILSAFFHDLGMAPTMEEVTTWKKYWDPSDHESEISQINYKDFKRFVESLPEENLQILKLTQSGQHTQAETAKGYVISEFIRKSHADRARLMLEKDWQSKIMFRDVDLLIDLAQICYSHCNNAVGLLDLDKSLLCGNENYACLPFVGVILRLSDILDFDGKRTPSILFSHLSVKHPISLAEWKKHRSVESWEIDSSKVNFNVTCDHPAIEATIHRFCDIIDDELSVCNKIVAQINSHNAQFGRDLKISLPFNVGRERIKTKKDIRNNPIYIYRDTQFKLSKKQVIDLLMGTKLYGNPEMALRELLQNSIDACLLRQAQEKVWNNQYKPVINLSYYQEDGEYILEVEDNGTGMDQNIIDNYYSKVGSSFYKSSDFYALKAESKAKFIPTSRFGIGILSCFMVSDTIEVQTKRVYGPHKSSEATKLRIEGQDSIFWITKGTREVPGTHTKLIIRNDKNPWISFTESDFINFVSRLIPNPPFELNINTSNKKLTKNEHSFTDLMSINISDYKWGGNDFIKTFKMEIKENKSGIRGSAVVGVLEKDGMPAKEVRLNSRQVQIEGNNFKLERYIYLSQNEVLERNKSVTINNEGQIRENTNSVSLAKSKSRVSLHGIEVPTSLFTESWKMKHNQARLNWPFPIILVLDVSGINDLDLNSARTEFIKSNKWNNFEEELAEIICSGLKENMTEVYWAELVKYINSNSLSLNFKNGFDKVS